MQTLCIQPHVQVQDTVQQRHHPLHWVALKAFLGAAQWARTDQ